MATRILVTGKYINSSTYVLFTEDGAGFRIDNQLRPFISIKVAKKKRKGYDSYVQEIQ